MFEDSSEEQVRIRVQTKEDILGIVMGSPTVYSHSGRYGQALFVLLYMKEMKFDSVMLPFSER